MAKIETLSPLAHRTPLTATDNTAALKEIPHLGKLILRSDSRIISDPVNAALDIKLPVKANRFNTRNDTHILWLGPDEWLIITAPDKQGAILEKLGKTLSDVHNQLVDVSDYYTLIEVKGIMARDILMKLTRLDLHPKYFGKGDVAGSNFGAAQATLFCTRKGTEQETFSLLIRWSMADYLWSMIADAGREFGMAEQSPEGQVELRP